VQLLLVESTLLVGNSFGNLSLFRIVRRRRSPLHLRVDLCSAPSGRSTNIPSNKNDDNLFVMVIGHFLCLLDRLP
jgi:hypothetical protein